MQQVTSPSQTLPALPSAPQAHRSTWESWEGRDSETRDFHFYIVIKLIKYTVYHSIPIKLLNMCYFVFCFYVFFTSNQLKTSRESKLPMMGAVVPNPSEAPLRRDWPSLGLTLR